MVVVAENATEGWWVANRGWWVSNEGCGGRKSDRGFGELNKVSNGGWWWATNTFPLKFRVTEVEGGGGQKKAPLFRISSEGGVVCAEGRVVTKKSPHLE